MLTRPVSANAPGTAATRFLICKALSQDSNAEAERLADQHCRDVPQVLECIKGAIAAATTTNAQAVLAQNLIGTEVFALLQSASIFGRLSPAFRRLPFKVKSPRELGAGVGAAWSGEGLPRPVSTTLYDMIEQAYHSVDAIVVLTKEAFQFGATSEAALRAAVIAGLARYVDAQLLDPNVSSAATHPASLTNSAVVVTSSGSTAANIIADLDSLLAAIESPGDNLRWVMRPKTFYRIAAKLAGVGLNVTPGNLLGIPAVLGSTSPQQVTLIDAAAVVYASDDTVAIDVTSKADVEMVDGGSSQDGTTGTGVQMVSLFQTNMIAIRAGIPVSWQHTAFNGGSPSQPSGVSYMTVAY